jgi:hypothetical protein
MIKGNSKKTKTDLADPAWNAPGRVKGRTAFTAEFSCDTFGPDPVEETKQVSESVLRSFFDSDGIMQGNVEAISEDDLRHIDAFKGKKHGFFTCLCHTD